MKLLSIVVTVALVFGCIATARSHTNNGETAPTNNATAETTPVPLPWIIIIREIVAGAATAGLNQFGSGRTGKLWPYIKGVMTPLLRRFPLEYPTDTPESRSTTRDALAALDDDHLLLPRRAL